MLRTMANYSIHTNSVDPDRSVPKGTLMEFLKEFLEKLDLKKIRRRQIKHAELPIKQRVLNFISGWITIFLMHLPVILIKAWKSGSYLTTRRSCLSLTAPSMTKQL